MAPGAFEVELGYYASKSAGAVGTRTVSFPILLKQGLTGFLELQVGSNGYTAVTAPGEPIASFFDDVVFGPKLHLVDQGTFAPSVSVSTELGLPTSATGHDAASFVAYASKDFGPLHGDANAGLSTYWAGPDAAAAATQPFAALALSATLVAPLGAAIEGYVFADAKPYASRDGGIRGALSLTPKPWLVVDFGGDVGFFPSTRAFSVFAGMTVLPVLFWRPSRLAR